MIERRLMPTLLHALKRKAAVVLLGHSGTERYPMADGVEAISLAGLAGELARLR